MNYFRYKQINKDLIIAAISYYLRYTLSYRDISEILRKRGIMLTIQRSVVRFRSIHLF